MKTYRHGLSLLLFCSILCCVAACDTRRESTRPPKVHALFILLKNDTYAIQTTVTRNQETMMDLMKLVSRHCEVNLTLMESLPGTEGEVTERRFVNNESKTKREYPQPDIIKHAQVTEWLSQVKTGPMDTLLIYFSGHGKMGRYGDHLLLFDKTDDENRLSRDVLEARLDEKPARLKMLITDTCSQMATEELLSRKTVEFVGVEPNARFFAKNLFLEHTGFLNVTAASPGKLAYGDTDIGGYFTSAIADSLNSDTDKDPKDNFLSWIEVFNAAKERTQKLAEQATPPKIQTPVAHLLPKSLRDTAEPPPEEAPSSPEERAHPAIADLQKTATLNITSTPSGATVYLDGNRIGATPLRGYEVDTGMRGQKTVTLGLEHKGYKSRVAKLTLDSGQTKEWKISLDPKQVRIETLATLEVTSTPNGATVYLEGNPIGTTPLRGYEVNTGVHGQKQVTVGLELSGYKSRVVKMTLLGGQTTPWGVRLEKEPERWEKVAVVTTDKGEFVIELHPETAPKTVENFKELIHQKFYDGLTFHRKVDESGLNIIQGGCPNGDGTGNPGWTIKDEYILPNQRPHLRGTIAMAQGKAPNSAGSQFYICLQPQPHLNGAYTTFGIVIEGMDVVDWLEMGDVITKIRLEARPE